ncbi:MAG: hypothetical protein QW520_01900 [Methanomassiliicoccales archaeon]
MIGNASASIEVWYPLTTYALLDQEKSTAFLGLGSSWAIYVVNHGAITDLSSFHARKGDFIRVMIFYRGTPYYEPRDLYLWKGDNNRLLLSSSEMVTGSDRIFVINL